MQSVPPHKMHIVYFKYHDYKNMVFQAFLDLAIKKNEILFNLEMFHLFLVQSHILTWSCGLYLN